MRKDSARATSKLTGMVGGRRRFLSDPPLLVPVSELLDQEAHLVLEEVVREALRSYRHSLPRSRRHLLEQFRYADAARKVVGVGSVGTRAWALLMLGVDDEPLVLQLKEATESVLEPFAGPSKLHHHGERVVAGQQLLQASSDVFLGWTRIPALDGAARDFYVRQLWDWKVSADIGRQDPATMAIYGQLCGWTLARGHARSGDRIAIAAYLGGGSAFDEAMADFATSYADQTERDYERFSAAVAREKDPRSGRVRLVSSGHDSDARPLSTVDGSAPDRGARWRLARPCRRAWAPSPRHDHGGKGVTCLMHRLETVAERPARVRDRSRPPEDGSGRPPWQGFMSGALGSCTCSRPRTSASWSW